MSLLHRRESRASSGGFFVNPPIPHAGMDVTSEEQALRVATVWACIDLITDAVSMLPIGAFRLETTGRRTPLTTPPQLIQKPSADSDLADWVSLILVSAMLRGNTYGLPTMHDASGWPTKIELQHPDMCSAQYDRSTGQLVYRIGGQQKDKSEVWHLKRWRMPGTAMGYSPITYAARNLGLQLDAEKFGADFFRNGMHPSSVLTSEKSIDKDQAKTIKERFRAATQNREPAVLGLGLKYTPIQIAPNESQFLETQRWGVSQIARVFKVPPEMVGGDSGGSMTYANVEQRNLNFLTFAVQPWLTRIENAITDILPRGQYVKFNTGALLRTDLKSRYESYGMGIKGHWLHPDEIRAFEEMPPLTPEQRADLLDINARITDTTEKLPTTSTGGAA